MRTSEVTKEEFKAMRIAIGKSPTDMASELGMSASAICNYESGRAPIPWLTARYLKEKFNEHKETLK